MIKNVLYFIGSVLLFFICMITYGIILNANESTLAEILQKKRITTVNNPRIVVEKSSNSLFLYSDKDLIKTYKVVFGQSKYNSHKSGRNSYTPVGDYKICSIDTSFKYHKFFRINYPSVTDASEAFKNGLISNSEYNKIIDEISQYGCTNSSNYFGSEIGLHGIGEYDLIFRNLPFVFNWTNGSIALSNNNIDELFSVVKINTPIKIIE